MKKLSHYDSAGRVTMVDIGGKEVTERKATARAFVAMSREVLKSLPNNPKGDPLEAARLAGIRPQTVTLLVFVGLGALNGLAAVLNLVQSPQADPKSGTGLELRAIARPSTT